MKKFTICSGIALAILAFSQLSFAYTYNKSVSGNYVVIEGSIVSVDKTKHLFVIKDKDDGKTYGLSAFASQIASLNQGDNVKVTVPYPGNLVSRITK